MIAWGSCARVMRPLKRGQSADAEHTAMAALKYELCSCCTEESGAAAQACRDGDGLHALHRDSVAAGVRSREAKKSLERPLFLDNVRVLDVQAGELLQVRPGCDEDEGDAPRCRGLTPARPLHVACRTGRRCS